MKSQQQMHFDWTIYSRGASYDVESAVRSYSVRKDSRHGERELAQACISGLFYLLDHTGNCVGPNRELQKLNYNASIDKIREAFAEYEEETLEEHKEMLEDDPEWAERHGDDHPWGTEEVAVMKAWLALDPFEWFVFRRSVKDAGVNALEDRLDEYMVSEYPEYTDVAEAVFKATKELMERFIERVEKELSEKTEAPAA